MATATLSTGLSRRAMLAGGVAAPAAFPLLGTLAALPEPILAAASADAAMFRRIAKAAGLRNRYAHARRLRDRIRRARWTREKTPPLPWRGPFPSCDIETTLHYLQLFHGYAVRCARPWRCQPARWCGNARIYMYEDRKWLEAALADLERLAQNRDAPRDARPEGRGRRPQNPISRLLPRC